MSLIMSSSSAGMMRRISASTEATIPSVSSMRVPTGARTCSRICPVSTDGKEVEADDLDQQQAGDAEDEHAREEQAPARDAEAQHAAVNAAQALELAIAPAVEP